MLDQRPPRAELLIDAVALRNNVSVLTERARRGGAGTMTIVKSDGYGHGVLTAARAALAGGAEWLGVAAVSEALHLRASGVAAPLLCWLYTRGEDFATAINAGVDLGTSSVDELREIAEAARVTRRRARLHLKIDTGLSRNGCPPGDWPALVSGAAELEQAGVVEVVAVWSHLACADEPGHPSIDEQARRFRRAHEQALAAGLRPLRHLANSAATLTRPDLHFDLVRPGIACYGLDPVPQDGDHGLRPAMTFRSSVSATKRIQAGEGVSYGHTWTGTRDTGLALVPVGYADGVPRSLSGRMSVWLNGKRRPVVGRVCMDQIVVDCGDDRVARGDEVVLFGAGDAGGPTAAEWADTLDTIHYEIVTSMYRPRVVRTPVGVDELVGAAE